MIILYVASPWNRNISVGGFKLDEEQRAWVRSCRCFHVKGHQPDETEHTNKVVLVHQMGLSCVKRDPVEIWRCFVQALWKHVKEWTMVRTRHTRLDYGNSVEDISHNLHFSLKQGNVQQCHQFRTDTKLWDPGTPKCYTITLILKCYFWKNSCQKAQICDAKHSLLAQVYCLKIKYGTEKCQQVHRTEESKLKMFSCSRRQLIQWDWKEGEKFMSADDRKQVHSCISANAVMGFGQD